MVMSNKYKISLVIIVLLPVLTFFVKDMVSEIAVDVLDGASDKADYYAVVDLNNQYRSTFGIITGANYDTSKSEVFDNVSLVALSRYFELSKEQRAKFNAAKAREAVRQELTKKQEEERKAKANAAATTATTTVTKIDPTTGEAVTTTVIEKPDEVSFIYTSKHNKFAVINGTLYKSGDRIAKNKKIIEITQKGVKIASEGKVKWLLLN